MRSLIVSAIASAGLLSVIMFAQTQRGTLTGNVVDPSGKVVANAAIQARNVESDARYDTVSTASGDYTLPELPAGNYEVTVTAAGFKKYIRQSLTIETAAIARIDIPLQVGEASETIVVTADASLLKTETSETSHNTTTKAVNELPVESTGTVANGTSGARSPSALIDTLPGTYFAGGAQIRINGTPNNSLGMRTDGLDVSNGTSAALTGGTQPATDAIQEITVQVTNYPPEYGQVGGGVFNATVKSGGNQFHGSAFDYFVNEVFNAGNPYTDAPAGTGNPRPVQRRNDYGFTVTGPVWIPKLYNGHNKTFFMFNLEEYRETSTVNNTFYTVPTLAYRQGNFSQALTAGKGQIGTTPQGSAILENEIFDPASNFVFNGQTLRLPFPGNIIPQTRFDPVAVKIQNFIPAPNGPNVNGLSNNFLPTVRWPRTNEQPDIKIDQLLGAKMKLAFFWEHLHVGGTGPGGSNGMPDPITVNSHYDVTAQVERLNYDYTISPTLLFHAVAGYMRHHQLTPSSNYENLYPEKFNACTQIGLCGAVLNTNFPPMSGLLATNGSGGMNNMGGDNDQDPQILKYAFAASLTWVKGSHTYKFGGEPRFDAYPIVYRTNTSGNYVFSGAQTSLPYLNGTTLQGTDPGMAYASFLLGQVQTVTLANPFDPRIGKHMIGLYAQDSWKVGRKFTLDYGLRYDYMTYLNETYGRDANFSPTVLNPAVGNIPGGVIFEGNAPGHCNCMFAKNYPWAFAPRLGGAYHLTPKTVLRGGAGIVYDQTGSQNGAAPALAGSSNTVAAPSYGAAVTTLSAGIPASFDPPPWPNLNPGQFNPTGTPVALSVPEIDQNAGRPARQYQWSFGIQREISQNLVVEAMYVGNRGIWWQAPGAININAINPATLTARGINLNNPADVTLLNSSLNSPVAISRGFGTPPYPTFPLTQTVAQSLRPFPQYTTINSLWDPDGDTWYEALQVKVNKRLSHGLSVTSGFAWSKQLDNGVENVSTAPGAAGNYAVFNNVFNRPNNKYLSVYDQPLNLTLTARYTTPTLHGNKWLSFLARDWTYGAFLHYASGFPIEAPIANNNLNSTIFQTTFADRVPGVPLFTVPNLNCHCYDPNAAFVLNPAAWTNPPAGQFGTSAAYYSDYRTMRRPTENMNLGRTWRFKERATFNLRIEFSDVFNRTKFNDPSASNFQAVQTRQPNGNTSSGFGYTNTSIFTSGTTLPTVINIQPRQGTLIGRFTF